MRYILTMLLISAATTAIGQESPAERIAPYLSDTSLAVGRIDLEALDVDAAQKRFQPFLTMVLRNSQNIEEQAVANLKSLQQAGFHEIYIVADLADVWSNPFYVVMPVPEGVEPPEGGLGPNDIVLKNVLISGSPRIVEYFQGEPKIAERPTLSDAFEAVAEAPIQVVIAPTADQRRVFREMLPDLSAEYGNVTGTQLAAGLKWAALGVDVEPKLTATVIIQSDSEEAAGALKRAVTTGLRQASINKTVLAAFPMAPLLVGALIPEQDGAQLTVRLDESLKVVSQALGTLVNAGRQDAFREQTTNHLKQLGLAMHNFHDTYKGFPPSASYSADGKPLLSWRVFVLPFLDESALYEQFHLDEPWDSEHNKKLIEKMPDVFRSPLTPTSPGMTVFQVPTGAGLLFDGKAGKAIKDISDGTSNTFMIVETTAEAAVPWTKPDDLEVDPEKPLVGLVEGRDGFWTTFGDGSVRFISSGVNPEVAYDAMTRAGGEVIPSEDLQPVRED